MKQATLLSGIISLLVSTSVFSEESSGGYKDFYLGQSKQQVKNLIKGKYTNVTFSANEDMKIETGEMVYTQLFFDHINTLYFIQVEIRAGEIPKVKQRLIDKYGQPNDYPGEEFNRENKSVLIGSWLIDKRYKVMLWESEYCRGSKLIPCIIYVDYIDLKLKDDKEMHEQKIKLDEQRKKDSRTYDGL